MNQCYLFCVVKKNNRKLRGVNFFFLVRGDEIYIRCCNPVTKRDTVANFNYEKKKGKEKISLQNSFVMQIRF